MLASRRSFLIGGAAFGTLGAFGGSRFIFAATGCKKGESPRLRFGVVSDIHITRVGANERMEAFGNNLTFRHALEWFREQNVDAVVIAGDMADRGLDDSLKHKNAGQKTVCLFARDALGSGDVCFTATPVNCFGARGKLIETRYASAQ